MTSGRLRHAHVPVGGFRAGVRTEQRSGHSCGPGVSVCVTQETNRALEVFGGAHRMAKTSGVPAAWQRL